MLVHFFTGVKKSLHGFNRRFEKREIEVVDDLTIDDTGRNASWAATSHKTDLPSLILKSKSIVTLADNRIATLVNVFNIKSEQAFANWVAKTDHAIDPSYI